MPFHKPSLHRRRFLQGVAASGAVAILSSNAKALQSSSQHDDDFFALLSDTHIPSSPDVSARGVNMTANLKSVIDQIGSLPQRPSNLFINGDCAYLKGLETDYANLAECVSPLDALGIDLYVTMGNHDDRQPLFDGLAGKLSEKTPDAPVVAGKHVSVIESEHANWFLLDSLFKVNVVTGELGDEQLDWLGEQLDSRRDKPALVMTHHNPQFSPPAKGKPWNGVSDTEALFSVLDARDHVKALFFGHSHNWNITQRGKIQLINLPPVAYVFAAGKPNGWVDARLSPEGMTLKLVTLDKKHPQADEQFEMKWT